VGNAKFYGFNGEKIIAGNNPQACQPRDWAIELSRFTSHGGLNAHKVPLTIDLFHIPRQYVACFKNNYGIRVQVLLIVLLSAENLQHQSARVALCFSKS